MKTISLLGSVIIFSSFSTNATELTFEAADNNAATQICMAAATDNTQEMVSKLKALSRRGTALSYQSFVNTIRCNDQYIGHFADIYDAQKSGAYLAKYTNNFNKKTKGETSIRDLANLQHKSTLVLVRGQK